MFTIDDVSAKIRSELGSLVQDIAMLYPDHLLEISSILEGIAQGLRFEHEADARKKREARRG